MIETEQQGSQTADRKGIILEWILFMFVAVLAWAATIWLAAGMLMGPMVPIHLFIFTWIVMMTAMMFPSVAPVALMWARSINSSTTGAPRLMRILLFVTGYLVVWGAFGFIAYGGSIAVTGLSIAYPDRSRWFVAGLFVVAGLYQLTPLKDVCLKHCRSPMSQLLTYASLKGRARDLRVGIHHGIYCVGCCWGIMLVLLGVGSMNLPAAGALAIVIFAEKIWARGQLISKAFGVLLIGMGILTLVLS